MASGRSKSSQFVELPGAKLNPSLYSDVPGVEQTQPNTGNTGCPENMKILQSQNILFLK